MNLNIQMIAAIANVRINGMARVAVAHRSIPAQHHLDGKRLAYSPDRTTKRRDKASWFDPTPSPLGTCCPQELSQQQGSFGELPPSGWARLILSRSLSS